MTLEALVFQQNPISSHGSKDEVHNFGGIDDHHGVNWRYGNNGFEQDRSSTSTSIMVQNVKEVQYDDDDTNSSSPEVMCGNNNIIIGRHHDGFFAAAGGFSQVVVEAPLDTVIMPCRRKRRRTRSSFKNEELVENQRITHITVERNRRRQMNDYLSVLRSLMPPSYVQRGDQASIVGGAINFVKELEQLLQSLESQKQMKQPRLANTIFSDFFTFPQYSTCSATQYNTILAATAPTETEKRSTIADIEVTMVESHANLKVLTQKQPKQLLKMLMRLQSLHLTILHLSITTTTVDHMVLYSISVKVEEDCQLTSVNDIATALYEMVGLIQEEASLSWKP